MIRYITYGNTCPSQTTHLISAIAFDLQENVQSLLRCNNVQSQCPKDHQWALPLPSSRAAKHGLSAEIKHSSGKPKFLVQKHFFGIFKCLDDDNDQKKILVYIKDSRSSLA